mmetsp:Transcript_17584/g.23749  ORF Transcript_17584/g.23749 Transcript_17584/m.23749 type:complete len:102 (+) Transcript_17584:1197-1502(+)
MCLETMDNLTFTIVLHDDCQLNSYDVAVEAAAASAQTKRSNSLISAFGSMLNNATNQSKTDGGFPMAFESEHVPEILQGFHKIQQRAYEKQAELNARFEKT